MAALTTHYPDYTRLMRGVLFIGLVILLVAVAAPVALNTHAVNRHGAEAVAIKQCMDQNGPQMVYKQRDGTFLLFCQLPDKRWGLQAVKRDSVAPHDYITRTAFVKGDGAWNTILRWLDSIQATPWKGPLP